MSPESTVATESIIRELKPELVDDYLRFFQDVYTMDPGLTQRAISGGEYAIAASTTILAQNKNVTQHPTLQTRTER